MKSAYVSPVVEIEILNIKDCILASPEGSGLSVGDEGVGNIVQW